MSPDPGCPAAYAVLRTDIPDLEGCTICFTFGWRKDVVVASIEALRLHVVGRLTDDVIT
jgi:hypothetical protein